MSDDVSSMVTRARIAQGAIADYSQEQVDELVTAVAWAVARKDRAEALAQLAVDEGGFGNYPDKVIKINKECWEYCATCARSAPWESSPKTLSGAW